MKHLIWASSAVLLASVALSQEAQAQEADKEYTLAIGETLTFSSRGVRNLTIGTETVATVVPTSDQRQLLVTGKAPGVTTINLYSSSSQRTLLIRVVPLNPTLLAEEARSILGDRSGVDVRIVKGRVVLEGEVASKSYKARVDKLVQLYPDQVLNFSTYRESFVEGAKMVSLEIDFVQLATTGRDRLGVNWGQFFGMNYTFGGGDVALTYGPDNLGDGILPGESNPARLPSSVGFIGQNFTQYFSYVGNLNLALDFLVENGMVKNIQHGVMVTEAGTEAEYHTGGSLLIRLAGAQATDLKEIPFGLRVKATPVVDVDNRVKISLEAIYSELDQSNGVEDLPALRTTELKGVVNMQEGQSVLLSGITSRQESSNETGFWLLSSIPILGWAFKSRVYTGSTLNNALFVTPRIYEPGGKVHKSLVKGIFEEMLESGVEPSELPQLSEAPPKKRTFKRKQ